MVDYPRNTDRIYSLQASTVASKPHLRRRGIVKASKQKDANETSSPEAEQSKGKYCYASSMYVKALVELV